MWSSEGKKEAKSKLRLPNVIEDEKVFPIYNESLQHHRRFLPTLSHNGN
jgi:hypothetical protein